MTFMTNDQWAERKGYTSFLADSGTGYLDTNKTPNLVQLNSLRKDAFAMIQRRIGSTGHSDDDFLLSLEYRLVEVLRTYEIAIKRGELEYLLKTVNQLLSLIPEVVAVDISLDSEDSRIQRGVTSG